MGREIPSEPGLPEPAERCREAEGVNRIDRDGTGGEARRYPMRAGQTRGPDGCRQAVDRIVSQPDRLILAVKSGDDGERAEYLGPVQLMVVRQAAMMVGCMNAVDPSNFRRRPP